MLCCWTSLDSVAALSTCEEYAKITGVNSFCLSQEGSLWSSEGTGTNSGLNEVSLSSSKKQHKTRTQRNEPRIQFSRGCHSSNLLPFLTYSTRCITPALQTEGSPRPTCSGSLSTPSPSPSLLSSPSASSTRTPRVASSRRIPTCPRASSIYRRPSASRTGRSRRRTRAPAPCSFETRSSRWN